MEQSNRQSLEIASLPNTLVNNLSFRLVVYRINFDEFVVSTSVLKNQGLKSLLQTYLPLRTNFQVTTSVVGAQRLAPLRQMWFK